MARLTPEDAAYFRKLGWIETNGVFSPPSAPAATPLQTPERISSNISGELNKSAEAQKKANIAADEARQASILTQQAANSKKKNPETFDREVARLKADAEVQKQAPPIFVGGWNPVTYTPLGLPVTTRPQDIAVPKSEAPGMLTALGPQVRAGEVAAGQDKRRVSEVFDDAAFYKTLEGKPEAERKNSLDAYEAYKAGFKKLREMNPESTGVRNEDILADLNRQIGEAQRGETKKFTHTPELEIATGGDATARAFQKQIETGTVPLYEPGALEFISVLKTRQLSDKAQAAADKEVARLKAEGVPVMKTILSKTEGPVEKQVGVRPATQADFDAASKSVKAMVEQTEAIPFFETPNRDEILANLEANATGGTLFEKQYPTGAGAESALSHGLRIAFSPWNAVAGAVFDPVMNTAAEIPYRLTGRGDLFITPEENKQTIESEKAARPPLYLDASAAVFNVAQGRGFMGESEDVWKFSPIPGVKDYSWIGTASGFAMDMLQPDAAAISAVTEGTRVGLAGLKAGTAAERAGGKVLAEAGAEAFKTAGSRFFKELGLEKMAGKFNPGDVRLKAGAIVGENFKAVDAYEKALLGGASHDEAVLAAKSVAPTSEAVAKMEKLGPEFETLLKDGKILENSAEEYSEFKKVAEAVEDLKAGTPGSELKLRPYIAAAAKSDVGVQKFLRGHNPAETLRLSDVLASVADRDAFANRVLDSASFSTGFKSIDRAVGSLEPGRAILAVTPKTFATESATAEILSKVKASQENKLLQNIQRDNKLATEPISYRVNGQEVQANGYKLKGVVRQPIRRLLLQEANTGTLAPIAAKRIAAELEHGVLSTQSIRELNYSIADRVAEEVRIGGKKTSFPSRALSDTAKSVDYGEHTNLLLNKLNKIAKSAKDWISPEASTHLSRLLNPEQMEAIADAKRQMAEIDKIFNSEFRALSNPEVAAAYHLEKDATATEKTLAITFGLNPSSDSVRTTLYNYVRSAIFGTDSLGGARFFTGFEYDTFETIFNAEGRTQVDEIIQRYADEISGESGFELQPYAKIVPRDVVPLLPQMLEEIAALKEVRYVVGGAKTEVPMYLAQKYMNDVSAIYTGKAPGESLVGAYARNKGDVIFAGAMEKALLGDPLTLGHTSQLLSSVMDKDYTILLNTAVVHQLSGAPPIRNLRDLVNLPGVRKLLGPNTEIFLKKNSYRTAEIIEDINATAAVVGRKFGGGVPAIQYANGFADLMAGEIKLSELGSGGNPFSLRKAVLAELGSAPKFGELQVELGKLAEEAARGSFSAARLSHYWGSFFDTLNSAFYNVILSYNPRFHGRNLISAPWIVHMTTGIGLDPTDMIDAARIVDFNPNRTAQQIAERGREVVVVDKLGNPYTAEDLYNVAVRSGALRSQMQATIDSKFLDEVAKLGVGERWGARVAFDVRDKAHTIGVPGFFDPVLKGNLKAFLAEPGNWATMEDNLWRCATIAHALKAGSTLEEALVLGRRSLFDYGAATQFERKYVAGRILFWNYYRNSVIQGARTLLANPARVLKQYRLITDTTKIAVGDETWDDLRFYTPTDNAAPGVASTVIDYSPLSGREGGLTVLPGMPYYDAAYLTTGLLYAPKDFLMGAPDLVTGEREYGSGFVFGKLSPTTKSLIGGLVGAGVLQDVSLKKNQLSATHVAMADQFGLLPTLTNMWGATARDAKPGEVAYDGKVWMLKPEAFEGYVKANQLALSNTGGGRLVDEYGKLFGWGQINGYAARGPSEFIGATSKYAMPAPIALQTEAATQAEMMLQKKTEERKRQLGITREQPKPR